MLTPPFRVAAQLAVAHWRASIPPAAGGGCAHPPGDSTPRAQPCAWSPDAGCVTPVIDGKWLYHRGPVLPPDHIHIIRQEAQRAGRKAPEVGSDQQGRQTHWLCREPHRSANGADAPQVHVQDEYSAVGTHPQTMMEDEPRLPWLEQSCQHLLLMNTCLNNPHS